MVDVMLIITAIVMTVVVFVGCFYFLVHFQSPDDKNQAWIPKIVVIIGLALACFVILLLPLDVGNKTTGGLELSGLWQFVLMSVAVMCFAVIPFCIFYYEEQDLDAGIASQCKSAISYTIITFIIAITAIVILYFLLGYSEIPAERYSALVIVGAQTSCTDGGSGGCDGKAIKLKIRVSFVVYVVASLSFLGWLLLVLFGGIGIVALPMDLINGYRTRPKAMDAPERARLKVDLQQRAARLIEKGRELEKAKQISGGRKRSYRRNYLAFQQSVFLLERDFEHLRIVEKDKGGSPIKWGFILFLGILGVLISLTWILHIILYMFIQPPASPFLNSVFIDLDGFFPLFGTVAYGLYSFYLLWAVIKGNVKFGLRILCVAIHPMKVGDTLMSSFLFNVLLILLSSVAVVQFCVQAFNQYARLTAAGSLFGTFVRYLMGISYFWQYVLYVFLGFAGLTLVYLLVWPKDKSKEEEIDLELIRLKGGVKV